MSEAWKNDLAPYWTPRLGEMLARADFPGLEEIRIRAEKPVQLLGGGRELLVPLAPGVAECQNLLERFCRHSPYAYQTELRACFLTLRGGYRVGLCGRICMEEGRIVRLSAATGFNVRIARALPGCADALVRLIRTPGGAASTLLLSEPGVGKTTALRDVARQLSDGGLKVCIADERGELSGGGGGSPALDVGLRTDVMEGCDKAAAMALMLRSMSPQVIVTDEIGGERDAAALFNAAYSGVAVIASAHAGSLSEFSHRRLSGALLQCFERVLLLRRQGGKLVAAEIREREREKGA